MKETYWSNVLSSRRSRRSVLSTAAAGSAAALFLAACGGGSKESSGSKGVKGDKSGLVMAPADMSKEAKRGGTVPFYMATDPASFDLYTAVPAVEPAQGLVHSHLLQIKPGYLQATDWDVMPDLAESYEFSPDKLHLTMKLRPGVKWHDIAPVNGRAMDVEDVTASWDRYAAKATTRADVVNSVNPAAPVLSLTAVDKSTIVVKLKEPVSYLAGIFAKYNTGLVAMIPKEADSQYDFKNKMIGTGPFQVAEYTQSVGFKFKRNPNYYEKDRPFVDGVNMPVLSEYAQGVAQLKAGNVFTYAVRQEDVVSIKQEAAGLTMYESDLASVQIRTIFGWQPAGQSPFRDERVRQAYSMSIDRDLFIESFYNVPKFREQGLPVTMKWNTVVAPDRYPGTWLDPQGKEFGDNAKYFKFDAAAAKQLLSAAGHANGLSVPSAIPNTTSYGTQFMNQVEVLEGMAAAVGFKISKSLLDYNATAFFNKYRDVNGKFEGMAYRLGTPAPATDPLSELLYEYDSKGGAAWLGFDAAGKGDNSGDPEVDRMLARAKGEFDPAKRKAIIADTQRYLAKTMYSVRWPGGASGFLLAWPALGNFQVFRSDNRQGSYSWWIDETKAPIKRA